MSKCQIVGNLMSRLKYFYLIFYVPVINQEYIYINEYIYMTALLSKLISTVIILLKWNYM